MIKSLIRLGLFLVVGILVYNFFLGTPEEKASSKRIFNEIADVGKSVGQLIKAEKEKFDQGKYNDALQKMGNIFNDLKEKAKDSGDLLDRINDLEEKKENLEKELELTEKGETEEQKAKELTRELEQLIEKTEDLANELKEE